MNEKLKYHNALEQAAAILNNTYHSGGEVNRKLLPSFYVDLFSAINKINDLKNRTDLTR